MTVRPSIVPHCVFGGFRMAREDWERTLEGHECDYDFEGLPTTVWPTEAECLRAIEEMG